MNRRRSKQPKSLAALIITAILGLIAAYFQGFTKPASQEKPTRPTPVESSKPTHLPLPRNGIASPRRRR